MRKSRIAFAVFQALIFGSIASAYAHGQESKVPAPYSAVPAPPKIKSISDRRTLRVEFPPAIGKSVFMEAPPALLPGGFRSIFFSTSYSYICATPQNPLKEPVTFKAEFCSLVSLPKYRSSSDQLIQPSQLPSGKDWMLNYDGVFSAHVIHDSAKNEDVLISVNHNETKNEILGANEYQNPFSKISVSECADGYGSYKNGSWIPSIDYQACWRAYDAFVSVEWGLFSQAENFGRKPYRADRGPAIWPTDGYYDSTGRKTSNGLRHPSSILYGGYLYIFYLDTSISSIDGLPSYGIKVARGAIGKTAFPGPFEVWSTKNGWLPALPANFNKDDLQKSMKTGGPAAPSLFSSEAAKGSSLNDVRFSVAFDEKQNLFLAVEEFIEKDKNNVNLALRSSRDLLHWSDRTILKLEGTDAPWSSCKFNYPVLSNADFNSNSRIDLADFYILGTGIDGSLNSVHLVFNLECKRGTFDAQNHEEMGNCITQGFVGC